MTIEYHCSECGASTTIDASPGRPAKLWGPPENCYPAEGTEFEPTACPQCETEFREEVVDELIEEEADNQRAAAADDAAERRWERDHGI